MKQKCALISVYEKDGILDFARELVELGWRILSSGGTAKYLAGEGVPVTTTAVFSGKCMAEKLMRDPEFLLYVDREIGDTTNPALMSRLTEVLAKGLEVGAMFDHRLATISSPLYGGLLSDQANESHMAELDAVGWEDIDMVVNDPYPMAKAIAAEGATEASVVGQVDVGGPFMIWAGTKSDRIVICRPEERRWVLDLLTEHGDVSVDERKLLRTIAGFEISKYMMAFAKYLSKGEFEAIMGHKIREFKGENGPQSPAGLYTTGTEDPLALDKFQLIEGSPLSYNNWCDLDRLLQTMTHISAAWKLNYKNTPNIAIAVKHGNPCGVSVGKDMCEVVHGMVKGDSRAIFGGFIMTNFGITEVTANAMALAMPNGKAIFDGVIAPYFDDEAVKILARAKDRCRLIKNAELLACSESPDTNMRFRYVRGGFLIQPNYTYILNLADPDMKIYGGEAEYYEKDLLLADSICRTSNSNTITIVKNGMLIGNGVGQQDRVGAAELAVKRAIDAGHGAPVVWWRRLLRLPQKNRLEGAVACSDSFFPFPDAVQVLINAGIKAIFSTSGSVNDEKVQDLCVKNGVSLYQLPDSKARGFFGH